MSHSVFLSSSLQPRMPDGSRNEWRGFFDSGGELRANAFFPLFWRALFSVDDIRHARFVDNYDVDDDVIEREECLEDFGPDARYPYLVVDKRVALARLADRRERVIAAVGERYRPIYEGLQAFIDRDFRDFILLRTSGLPDAADAEPWLRADLAALDTLDSGRTLAELARDLSAYGADPVWHLAGTGGSHAGPWPTPELRALFPLEGRGPIVPSARPGLAAERAAQARPRPGKPRGWLDSALEWLGALASAAAAFAAYAYTHSGWLALLAFLCVAVGIGMTLVKLRGPRA